MSDDKFLKVMLFGSPFRKKLMKRPLLGYALVGYSLGFWGYMTYRSVRDYIEAEREANERHERYGAYWNERNLQDSLARIRSDFQRSVDRNFNTN